MDIGIVKRLGLVLPVLVLVLVLTGCATGTLETRKQERYGAYTNLTPEQKISVDLGQIKVGMSMDAVYIAWGKPTQILSGETSKGAQVRWLYSRTHVQSVTYWTYSRGYWPYHRHYGGSDYVHDYTVIPYISAEVVFEGGVVKEWRTLPKPGN